MAGATYGTALKSKSIAFNRYGAIDYGVGCGRQQSNAQRYRQVGCIRRRGATDQRATPFTDSRIAMAELPLEALSAPAEHAGPVTPSDSADLGDEARALIIGVAGNLKVTTVGGETVTLTAVPAGILPLRVVRVFATGTTATNISALW